ncbi:P-loop containing nucleoside triphosphate hydrolase protein [Cladorrhinum sp. PSN332]|nr:P-loop containing nucleoside triphosphate hydrolase protein [Cladorrhinum sp. PSN332]
MQPTHVLSACYRFISNLSDAVPQVHILLGNHDLAYRRDYQTSALDALNIKRLAPYVSIHSDVAHDEWDGRPVSLLPFREEQNELTDAIAALDSAQASNTVAFGHLAINKAVIQRCVVGADADHPPAINSITYRGFTGPGRFASLARTFTGHFHSHQSILQEQPGRKKPNLKGSITYLGSPLQLNWGDLYDENRGVVLFNPKTLKHELLLNPHALGYVTAELEQVLDGQVDEDAVTNKHVMLLGKLTQLKYATARDKLLSLGVRSVRNWTPMGFALHTQQTTFGGLGASVPASDAAVHTLEEPIKDEADKPSPEAMANSVSGFDPGTELQAERLDLVAEARQYVASLDLDESMLSRRDELVRVGQRMIQASREIAGEDGDRNADYQDFLDSSSQGVGTRTASEPAGSSSHIFVAEPRTLTITNFLGIQNTISIDFRDDIPRGLTFLTGDNGSGKSTLVEAMTWCQFGRCIRDGMAVNDAVNDNIGKNCSVALEFANGYAITRYRKHKTHSNRVMVSLNGEAQPQFEHPDARTTQAAINELLGTDYETYVRTVVLSHGGAASFLTSTAAERRDLIEELLGLSILDQCGQVSRLLLRNIDSDMNKIKSELEGSRRTIDYTQRRLEDLKRTQNRIENEAQQAVKSLKAAVRCHEATELRIKKQAPYDEEQVQLEHGTSGLELEAPDNGHQSSMEQIAEEEIPEEGKVAEAPKLSMEFRNDLSALQNEIRTEQDNLQQLERSFAQLQEQERNHPESTSWLGQLQQKLSQNLEAIAQTRLTGLQKVIYTLQTSVLSVLLAATRRLMRIAGISRDETQRHKEQASVNNVREEIEKRTSRLQSLKHKEQLAISHAVAISEQLAQAMRAQKALEAKRAQKAMEAMRAQKAIEAKRAQKAMEAMRAQKKLEAIRARNALELMRTQKACEASRQQVTIKQGDAATYKRLVEEENSSLQALRSEHNELGTKLEALAADRELFVFWSSALAKRTRGASATSSSSGAAKGATANFREHIFEKSLPELNSLLKQILTVLYDDTRHARVATGMLRSLYNSDGRDVKPNASSSSGSVLDRSLTVHPSLAYGKRSTGERKRIDLALFFALLQLARARSAHRAHYVLVDEVFDSLDLAGQTAVVRWCSAMSQTLFGWTVVITHSQFLVDRDSGEEAGKVLVVKAKMGEEGTELVVDGKRIGMD